MFGNFGYRGLRTFQDSGFRIQGIQGFEFRVSGLVACIGFRVRGDCLQPLTASPVLRRPLCSFCRLLALISPLRSRSLALSRFGFPVFGFWDFGLWLHISSLSALDPDGRHPHPTPYTPRAKPGIRPPSPAGRTKTMSGCVKTNASISEAWRDPDGTRWLLP